MGDTANREEFYAFINKATDKFDSMDKLHATRDGLEDAEASIDAKLETLKKAINKKDFLAKELQELAKLRTDLSKVESHGLLKRDFDKESAAVAAEIESLNRQVAGLQALKSSLADSQAVAAELQAMKKDFVSWKDFYKNNKTVAEAIKLRGDEVIGVREELDKFRLQVKEEHQELISKEQLSKNIRELKNEIDSIRSSVQNLSEAEVEDLTEYVTKNELTAELDKMRSLLKGIEGLEEITREIHRIDDLSNELGRVEEAVKELNARGSPTKGAEILEEYKDLREEVDYLKVNFASSSDMNQLSNSTDMELSSLRKQVQRLSVQAEDERIEHHKRIAELDEKIHEIHTLKRELAPQLAGAWLVEKKTATPAQHAAEKAQERAEPGILSRFWNGVINFFTEEDAAAGEKEKQAADVRAETRHGMPVQKPEPKQKFEVKEIAEKRLERPAVEEKEAEETPEIEEEKSSNWVLFLILGLLIVIAAIVIYLLKTPGAIPIIPDNITGNVTIPGVITGIGTGVNETSEPSANLTGNATGGTAPNATAPDGEQALSKEEQDCINRFECTPTGTPDEFNFDCHYDLDAKICRCFKGEESRCFRERIRPAENMTAVPEVSAAGTNQSEVFVPLTQPSIGQKIGAWFGLYRNYFLAGVILIALIIIVMKLFSSDEEGPQASRPVPGNDLFNEAEVKARDQECEEDKGQGFLAGIRKAVTGFFVEEIPEEKQAELPAAQARHEEPKVPEEAPEEEEKNKPAKEDKDKKKGKGKREVVSMDDFLYESIEVDEKE